MQPRPDKNTIRTTAYTLMVVALGCTGEPAALVVTSGQEVNVEQIVKGDELNVEHDRQQTRVRMLGVHAFSDSLDDEKVAVLGRQANAWLADRVAEQRVRLVLGQVSKDSAGRYLAYIEHQGNDINAAMIAAGQAVVYSEYPFERETDYLAQEAKARDASQGLWAEREVVELIKGLRRQWLSSRRDESFVDPLLGEATAGDDAP
ncbi:MAG: thermonuclease family protein [Myxococcota bacterium]